MIYGRHLTLEKQATLSANVYFVVAKWVHQTYSSHNAKEEAVLSSISKPLGK